MSYFRLPLVFLSILLALDSCKPMPNDGIPFFIKMDSVSVSTLASVQGLGTHQITDVWVEANADNLGVYEVPCNFPVLQENEVRFVLSAGIEESSQSDVRVIYPFYQPDTFTVQASRGEKYSHIPVFKYKAGTQFAFIENFDASNGFSGMLPTSDSNVAYGNRCGVLNVTTLDSASEAKQSAGRDLPEGQEIWVEIDYKSEVPFIIGYYGNFSSGTSVRIPVLYVSAKNNWNKVYVKLSSYIASTDADTYSVYFEALRPVNTNGGNLYIDNVKVLHF